MYIRVLVKIRG